MYLLIVFPIVGESAGRPYTSLAKRDGRSGCAYIKRQVDREMERGPRGIGGSSAGGLGGQFNKNREVGSPPRDGSVYSGYLGDLAKFPV